MMWDQHLVEITRFSKPIAQVAVGRSGHVVIMLVDHDVLSVELVPGARPHRLIGGGQLSPVISADGLTLVAPGNGLQLTIVELASAMRWTLPQMFAATQTLSVSPSSRRVVQGAYGALMVWTLPTTATDFTAWLEEQSNAVKHGDDVLAWPWQVRRP
ncbi:MAG: hypothetical protein JWP01_2626 [Myxococcales bacterium]|nr:hypothetical protein [Myxococcales bacterium]